jgi:hypothetical protein
MEDGAFVPFVVSLVWKEMNDRSFEDHKRTLEEIKYLFFNTLNLWTVAYVSSVVISYHDLFILSLIVRWLVLYTFYVHGASYTFNDILIAY